MKISCKCITYGRVEFLEESLYSFLNQEYEDEHELVIVNDYPLQKLVFDHPRVRIFNLDRTFETIGEKENFAVSQCKYDVIAVWDDDDIALPNHLSNIKLYFKDCKLLHWGNGGYFNVPNLTSITQLGNSGIVYTKEVWEEVGKHSLENAGYDMTFTNKISQIKGAVKYAYPPPNEISWFYVWGGRGYHMSGQGTDDGSKPNVIKRHSDHVEQQRKLGKIPTGTIILNPNWKINYKEKLLNYGTS
jgi:glycosyltransferase involved in cell wall biosynthesis